LNAKHRNEKRAANGRTYHAEDKVRHQSSSLVAERGDTTEHESANNANDGSTHLLKVSNLIQARRCDCAQSLASMKPPHTEYLA
jgi:hypothetical protein